MNAIRIKNTPEFANFDLICSFLNQSPSEILKILIKDTYADVYFASEEPMEKALELDGKEILGYSVNIKILTNSEASDAEEPDLTSPEERAEKSEIFIEKHRVDVLEKKYLEGKGNVESEYTIKVSELEILNETGNFRKILKDFRLQQRMELPEQDPLRLFTNVQTSVFVILISLILMVAVNPPFS